MLIPFKDLKPSVHEDAYIAEGAKLIGDVRVGKDVGIWYNAVLRADIGTIEIGERTNVQDLVVIHTNPEQGTFIGNDVTIGHGAIIHSATIHDNALIGMGSIILDGAIIGENALVGAGCVVPPMKEVPKRSLAVGNPMKIIRELTDHEIEDIKNNKNSYVNLVFENNSIKR